MQRLAFAVGAALGAGSVVGAGRAPPRPHILSPARRIDGHVHLTNISLLQYLWANASAGVCPCAPPCLCEWRVADWAAATAILPSSKFVFCEVDVNSTQWLTEATWVQSLSDAGEAAVGGIVAQAPPGFGLAATPVPQLQTALSQLAELPLGRGIRGGGIAWANASAVAALSAHVGLLHEHALSFDVNAAIAEPGVAAGVQALVTAHPTTTFILDHCGGPPVAGTPAAQAAWRQAIASLAQGTGPNLVVKVGGIVQGFKGTGVLPSPAAVQPWAEACIAAFGFERALFEGNWFFTDWRQPADLDVYNSIWAPTVQAALTALRATPAQQDAFFYGTAAAAYRVQG